MQEELEKVLSEFQESKTFSYDHEVKGDPAELRDAVMNTVRSELTNIFEILLYNGWIEQESINEIWERI